MINNGNTLLLFVMLVIWLSITVEEYIKISINTINLKSATEKKTINSILCHAVGILREGGFLTMDEEHYLHLTDIGREVAEIIYERHCFFTEQLIAAGVDPKIAEADACRIEHVISSETFERLKEAAEQE